MFEKYSRSTNELAVILNRRFETVLTNLVRNLYDVVCINIVSFCSKVLCSRPVVRYI